MIWIFIKHRQRLLRNFVSYIWCNYGDNSGTQLMYAYQRKLTYSFCETGIVSQIMIVRFQKTIFNYVEYKVYVKCSGLNDIKNSLNLKKSTCILQLLCESDVNFG